MTKLWVQVKWLGGCRHKVELPMCAFLKIYQARHLEGTLKHSVLENLLLFTNMFSVSPDGKSWTVR